MGQRQRLKMWRNGRGGAWSTRIIWFEEDTDINIRLELNDCEREIQVYPKTKEEADHIWFMFKQGSPVEGARVPFITDLAKLLEKKYPETFGMHT